MKLQNLFVQMQGMNFRRIPVMKNNEVDSMKNYNKIILLIEKLRTITSFKDFMIRLKRKLVKLWGDTGYKIKEGKNPHSSYRVTQITYYKVWNLGDTVLSQCVRRTLEQLCGILNYHIVAVNSPVTGQLIDQINNSRLLVIGGGGLFLPDSNENSVSGWQWAISKEDLMKIKVPIIIYTVGYNYFRGQQPNVLFEDSLRTIISRSAFVGLRNNGSIREVEKILGEDKAEIDSCPDIIYQPCTTALIRKLYPELPKKKKTGEIALNVAFDRAQLRYGNDQSEILSQIAMAMKELEARGYKINYIAHCKDDLAFLPYLDQISIAYKKVDMSDWFPHKAIAFYNDMDCVLGMRGHAQMIPFGLNCEIISLGSHEKMRWFLEDIHAADWYIELTKDIHSLKNRIVDTFIRIHEKEPFVTQSRLLAAQERLWEISIENAGKICKIMENSNRGKEKHS